MSRSCVASISASALIHNFRRIKTLAPGAKIWSVIKSNAYGHGDLSVAKILAPHTDGFAVAHFEEAEILRGCGIHCPILLLEGVQCKAHAMKLAQLELTPVVSDIDNLDCLLEYLSGQLQYKQLQDEKLNIWLKMDSGMHRLGIPAPEFAKLVERLRGNQYIQVQGLMTHFACADEPSPMNQQQLETFDRQKPSGQYIESLANSALVFTHPEAHRDWIRPGIALYGSSSILNESAEALGLDPVMSFISKVISIKTLYVGDSVGYGATWVSDCVQKIAVVGVGYGDGYPRHIKGAHLWVKGRLCPVVGRVSMDMLTILIPDDLDVQRGDEAECWGSNISVDDVARQAGTISYELLCQVTSRVPRIYC